MNIEECLKKYSNSYYENMFALSNTKTSDSYSHAIEFMHHYALSDEDYLRECYPLMEKVFKLSDSMEFDIYTSSLEILFQPDFHLFIHISSPIFTKENFLSVKNICKAYGEDYIYIVEDNYEETAIQLRIPSSISWNDLLSGGFMSNILFNMPYNKCRIFGSSGNWGRWCDYENTWIDYEIFGYKKENAEVIEYNRLMSLSEAEYDNLHQMAGVSPHLRKYFLT